MQTIRNEAIEQAARDELIRLLSDRMWRLNNLYWIIDKSGRRVKFELNWAQEQLLRDIWYCNLILKARQLGITTFWCILYLDVTTFNPNVNCGFIAHNLNDARSIFATKIKYPYDNLPEGIKQANPPIRDSSMELALRNNSSIRVGTSLRSGTLQFLHVSELGKIAAKFPERAREIRTGALNTIQSGQYVSIESTAEGAEGDFYSLCQTAQSLQRQGTKLTPLDFRFHFLPWHKMPEYRIPADDVIIPPPLRDYFEALRLQHGIELDAEQQAWYAKKAETQFEDMKREYPSTPEESFAASVEGSYYGNLIGQAEREGSIGDFPAVEGVPVHTAMDIGRRDATAIWFWQRFHNRVRCVYAFEAEGEAMPFYAAKCKELYEKHGWTREDAVDYVPHDARVEEWGSGRTRIEQLIEAGFNPRVPTAMGLHDGINAARELLRITEFDAEGCAQGLKALRQYRKTWNDDAGVWSNVPFHNWCSHFADSYRYLSAAYRDPGVPAKVVQAPPLGTYGDMIKEQMQAAQRTRRR